MQRSRSRNRFGGKTQFEILRDAAQAAALANGASLWYAGRQQDLSGFVFQDSAGTTPATGTDPIGLLVDRTGSFNASQATAASKPTLELQANGYYGMRFDGTNDSLTLSVIPLSITSNTIIVGGRSTSGAAADRTAVTQRSAGNAIVGQIDWVSSGPNILRYVQRSDAGTIVSLTDGTATYTDVPVVVTGRTGAGSAQLLVNGVSKATSASSLGTATPTGAAMGIVAVANVNPMLGLLYLVCQSPIDMPTADRIAIERFAALLSGAAYV